MKNKGLLFAVLALLVVSVNHLSALRVNPMSAVMGDSANETETLVYRDTNGDFSARVVSVRSIVPSDTSSSRNHLPLISTTTLLTLSPSAAGDLYAVVDSANTFLRLCVSTGTGANAVVISSAVASKCIN